MIKEIKDKTVKKMEELEYFECAYNDGEETNPKEFEDDNFIHIARGKYRFIFYNGQEENALTEKDVKRFAKLVDGVLSKENKPIIKQIMKAKKDCKYCGGRGYCQLLVGGVSVCKCITNQIDIRTYDNKTTRLKITKDGYGFNLIIE